MNNDDLEVAKLAAMVSGNLKRVDSQTVTQSATSGPANKINPRRFIQQPIPQPHMSQPHMNQTEVLERVPIDSTTLQIPIPEDMKQYVEKYQQPTIQKSPVPVGFTPAPSDAPSSTINNTDILNMILTYIENIDNKLDLIIKKTKIQGRKSKKGQHGRQRNLAQSVEQPKI